MKNYFFLLLAAGLMLISLGCNKEDSLQEGEPAFKFEVSGAAERSFDVDLSGATGADYSTSGVYENDGELLTVRIQQFPEWSLKLSGVKSGGFGKGTYSLDSDNPCSYGSNSDGIFRSTGGTLKITDTKKLVGGLLGDTYLIKGEFDITMENTTDPGSTIQIKGDFTRITLIVD